MTATLTIERFMTPSPLTIGVEQPLAMAHRMMNEHQVRHLPVLHDGTVVGVVSHRDLALIETLPGVDPECVTVEQAMSADPYVVTPTTKLARVARTMAARKYGCCVVAYRGHVVGIFTTVDGMSALAGLLEPRPSLSRPAAPR